MTRSDADVETVQCGRRWVPGTYDACGGDSCAGGCSLLGALILVRAGGRHSRGGAGVVGQPLSPCRLLIVASTSTFRRRDDRLQLLFLSALGYELGQSHCRPCPCFRNIKLLVVCGDLLKAARVDGCDRLLREIASHVLSKTSTAPGFWIHLKIVRQSQQVLGNGIQSLGNRDHRLFRLSSKLSKGEASATTRRPNKGPISHQQDAVVQP